MHFHFILLDLILSFINFFNAFNSLVEGFLALIDNLLEAHILHLISQFGWICAILYLNLGILGKRKCSSDFFSYLGDVLGNLFAFFLSFSPSCLHLRYFLAVVQPGYSRFCYFHLAFNLVFIFNVLAYFAVVCFDFI